MNSDQPLVVIPMTKGSSEPPCLDEDGEDLLRDPRKNEHNSSALSLNLNPHHPHDEQKNVTEDQRKGGYNNYVKWLEEENAQEVNIKGFNLKGTLIQLDLTAKLERHLEEQAFESTHVGFPTDCQLI